MIISEEVKGMIAAIITPFKARYLHLRLQELNRFLEYAPGYVSPA